MKRYRGREGRQRFASRHFPEVFEVEYIADVGGGENLLSEEVDSRKGSGRIFSLDLYGNPSVRVDLDQGRVPLGPRSFDSIVALEVLEHLEEVHTVFDQLLDTGNKYFLFTFPNMLHWFFRVKFLRGDTLSGKYGLPPYSPNDRHRWLTSVKESRAFVRNRVQQHPGEWSIHREILSGFEFNRYSARIINFLVENFGGENLRTWTYWCLLKR